MGHFIGVWDLSGSLQWQDLATSLEAATVRLGGRTTSFENDRGILKCVEFHGSDASHVLSPDRAVTLAVGDPLHPGRQVPTPKGSVEALHDDLRDSGFDRLARLRGQFAACHVDPDFGRLVLIGDRLGIRPVFLWRTGSIVAFSTSFSALLSLRDGPVTAVPESVWEIMALGYALEDRTLSADVELLPVGTALVAGRSVQFRKIYPDLQAGILVEATDDELVEELDARFTDAVRIRTMGSQGQRQLSFLSGGLDSRAIVSKLVQLGERVTTVNVAPPGTLDAELGERAASRLGTRHRHFDMRKVRGRLSTLMRIATQEVWAEEESIPSSRGVWSGQGGSLIIGGLDLTQTILDLAVSRQWDPMARHLLNELGAAIPLRLVGRDHRERAGPDLVETVASVLKASGSSRAPAESPHLFLLGSQVRRSLHSYYSQSGPGDYEPILPFFDSEFGDWIVQVPVERKLNHRLYHRWLLSGALSPAEEVPWQTYPGHEPCPLPLPNELPDQWSSRSAWYPERMQRKIGRSTALQAVRGMRGGIFPSSQLDMRYATFAIAASLIGFSRWRYVPEVLARLALR